MNRRQFLESTAVASGKGALGAGAIAQESTRTTPQYYELRLFHMRTDPRGERFNIRMKEAHIPAANLAGIEPVGVFNVVFGTDSPTSYVLLPHKSIESVATLCSKMEKDKDYQTAGAAIRHLTATDPGYARLDSSLMVAFGNDDEWKKLRDTPGYRNIETVSNFHALILRPAGYSQI